VLVSAAISPAGPPRQIVTAWTNERFELIVSPSVLDELADVLARPKFRRFITAAIAVAFTPIPRPPRYVTARRLTCAPHQMPIWIITQRAMPTPPPGHQKPYGISADASG